MPAPNVRVVDNREMGYWQVWVYPSSMSSAQWFPGTAVSQRVNVTTVRGLPTVINSMTFTEPFGPAEANLTFPGISPLEPIGFGSSDLWWLQPDIDIDIEWHATDPDVVAMLQALGLPTYTVWEGFITSFDWRTGQGDAVSIGCTGAMRILDSRVSQRVVSDQPVSFEYAIRNAFDEAASRHTTRLKPFQFDIHKPTARTYSEDYYTIDGKKIGKRLWYLKPKDITTGMLWTGMLTRELGSWGKVLSEYVMTLLKLMQTETGQYTIQLDHGRKPVMRHRLNYTNTVGLAGEMDGVTTAEIIRLQKAYQDAWVDPRRILIVDLALPGVSTQLTSDYGQSVTTVYGNVNTTLSGTQYNGIRFSGDGKYWYEPLGKTPWVDSDHRDKVRPLAVRREVYDDFPDGLTPDEARASAQRFLAINGTPGVIGSVTLDGVDPVCRYEGELLPFPRQLVKAPALVRLDGWAGQNPGPIVFANEVTYTSDSDSLTLQVDSKFRDFMTTADVKMRGRDALLPNYTAHTKNGFNMNVQDPHLPWSYERGCGYFPYSSRQLWKMYAPNGSEPEWWEGWEEMTKAFPPKKWPLYYSWIPASKEGRGTKKNPISPARFWNFHGQIGEAHPFFNLLLLSQGGTIFNTQIMAVNREGVRMPVSFHVSLWNTYTATASNTPRIPTSKEKWPGSELPLKWVSNGYAKQLVYAPDGRRWYKTGTPYPFFKHAWYREENEYGTVSQDAMIGPRDQSNMIQGWGNSVERAGYYPFTSRTNDQPTGLFMDTSEWTFDMLQGGKPYNQNEGAPNDFNEICMASCLVFCDDAPAEDLYFIGRFYKKPAEG